MRSHRKRDADSSGGMIVHSQQVSLFKFKFIITRIMQTTTAINFTEFSMCNCSVTCRWAWYHGRGTKSYFPLECPNALVRSMDGEPHVFEMTYHPMWLNTRTTPWVTASCKLSIDKQCRLLVVHRNSTSSTGVPYSCILPAGFCPYFICNACCRPNPDDTDETQTEL